MPLLYILQQPISVDGQDPQGHTSLMWAAYQGDAISVDILLRHGASVALRDSAGLTPLHWAVVRGNRFCIKRLIEAGADIHAKDDSGKTPRDMAVELKSSAAFAKALEESGFGEDGIRTTTLMNQVLFDIYLSLSFSNLLGVNYSGIQNTRSLLFPRFYFSSSSPRFPSSHGIPPFPSLQPDSLLCTM
jgi:ankyrin repeat protein